MKNRLYTTILFIVLLSFQTTPTRAQDIIKYFIDMPGYLLPSLESSHKLELMENYLQNAKKDSAQNLFGGKMRVLQLDTAMRYISIQPASVSRFEMKVFERQDKSKFIAVINTVCGSVCSSYIRFYDTDWKEISVNFPALTNNHWLKSTEQMVEGAKITDIFNVSFIELSFNPNSGTIEAKNNSLDFLTTEEKMKVEPFVEKKNIPIKWSGGRFSL